MTRNDCVICAMLPGKHAILYATGREAISNYDAMLLFALVRAIEVIGEAAVHLSDLFKEQHPEIPWMKIIGMRNRLIHGYFTVDANVVWDTATIDIPKLKKLLDGILSS